VPSRSGSAPRKWCSSGSAMSSREDAPDPDGCIWRSVHFRCADRPITRVCAGGGLMSDLPAATPTACVVCGARCRRISGRRPRSTPSWCSASSISRNGGSPKRRRQNDPDKRTEWNLCEWNGLYCATNGVDLPPMTREEIKEAAAWLRERCYPIPADCPERRARNTAHRVSWAPATSR